VPRREREISEMKKASLLRRAVLKICHMPLISCHVKHLKPYIVDEKWGKIRGTEQHTVLQGMVFVFRRVFPFLIMQPVEDIGGRYRRRFAM
jgi:hypothetical protein